MQRKAKKSKRENSSLLSYLSRQNPNNPLEVGVPKGFRGSRLRMN